MFNSQRPSPFSEFLVEFWPSKQELVDDGKNTYLKELTGFYDSISQLESKARMQRIGFRPYTDLSTDQGTSGIARFSPPEIVEWVFGIATAGAAYNLLRIWLTERKGRQVRIVVHGLEVEATHCSDKQFDALLEVLRQHNEQLLADLTAGTDLDRAQMQDEVNSQQYSRTRHSGKVSHGVE